MEYSLSFAHKVDIARQNDNRPNHVCLNGISAVVRGLTPALAGLMFLLLLQACGSVTPDIIRNPESEYDVGQFVDDTAGHVRCELRAAVKNARVNRDARFLEIWSAKITMTLFVDERLNLAGGANVTDDISGAILKSLSLGFGASLNQNATRRIELSWYESFADLLQQEYKICGRNSNARISGDLKIAESLNAMIFPATSAGAAFRDFTDGKGPIDSIQNTITFDVAAGASANPSFVLSNATLNGGTTLISANRDRMDQLLITMGPGILEDTKRPYNKTVVVRPSRELIDAHNTGRFGLQIQTYSPRRFFQ